MWKNMLVSHPAAFDGVPRVLSPNTSEAAAEGEIQNRRSL